MDNNLMKKAHEMTKEIMKEFPGTDYKFQLGLCIDFLKGNKYLIEETSEVAAAKEEKEDKNTLPQLQGSTEEIMEASEIRKHMIENALEDKEKFDLKSREIKIRFYATNIDRFLKRTELETNAKWYIVNKGLQAKYFSRFVEVK
jgi:hypothetical protein